MLKKYKNKLVQKIQDAGLQLTEFDVNEHIDGEHDVFVLTYRNTEFKYELRNYRKDFHSFDCRYTRFAPAFPLSDYIPNSGYTNFDDIIIFFDKWFGGIKEYLDELLEPDLWESIRNSQKILFDKNLLMDVEKSFTIEEKEPIRIAINELKFMIEKKFLLDEEQKLIVNDRLEYLSRSLDRLNKIDWKGLALSTMVGISIALSLDTTKGTELMNLFKTVFSNVLHYLQ